MRRASCLLLLLLMAACASNLPEVLPDGPDARSAHWVVEIAGEGAVGSATVVGERLALTNRHVVAGAMLHGRGVSLVRGSTRVAAALRLVAPDLDLAVLEAAAALSGSVEPARAMPPRGALLYAAGTARGVPQRAVGRLLGSDPFEPAMLLARLPARPGFSGGPVLDAEGRLIGLVTAAVVESQTRARDLAAGSQAANAGTPMVRVLSIGAILARIGPYAGMLSSPR